MFPRKEFQEADGVAVEKAVNVGGDEFVDVVVVVVVVDVDVVAVVVDDDIVEGKLTGFDLIDRSVVDVG